MFNSFPYDKWSNDIAEFWTFGPANSTGTYIMTVLGVIFMLASLYGFVTMENAKLEHQAEALRASGALGQAEPTPPPAA